jgi:hypothetical protein
MYFPVVVVHLKLEGLWQTLRRKGQMAKTKDKC